MAEWKKIDLERADDAADMIHEIVTIYSDEILKAIEKRGCTGVTVWQICIETGLPPAVVTIVAHALCAHKLLISEIGFSLTAPDGSPSWEEPSGFTPMPETPEPEPECEEEEGCDCGDEDCGGEAECGEPSITVEEGYGPALKPSASTGL